MQRLMAHAFSSDICEMGIQTLQLLRCGASSDEVSSVESVTAFPLPHDDVTRRLLHVLGFRTAKAEATAKAKPRLSANSASRSTPPCIQRSRARGASRDPS